MKRWRGLVGGMWAAALLAGCGGERAEPVGAVTEPPAQAQAVAPGGVPAPVQPPAQVQAPAAAVVADVATLKAKHANQPLSVVDVSELDVRGASALVVSFSVPLDPDQRFDTLLTLADAQGGRLEGGWVLSDNLQELRRQPLEPERRLSLQIAAGLRSVAGVELGRTASHTLTTRAQTPSLGFASRGSLLPLRLADGLPVIALNVDKVDVEFFRIRPEQLHGFLSEWNRQSAMELWQLGDLPAKAQLVHTAQFALNPPPNTRERLMLPLDDIAALAEPGVFVAVMRRSGTFEYSLPVTVFSRSDIGLSVRRSAAGLDAFVQSLDGGVPLAEVRLELLDARGLMLAEGRSGSDGHVRLPTHKDARLLLATRERSTTLIRLQDAALDLAEFPVSGPRAGALTLFAFGPRDLYRPGETVLVNALLRDADGRALSSQPHQPIPTRILRPDGEVVRSFVWQADAEGLYQYRYPLSDSAQTGRWRMQMELGGESAAMYEFLVEDFLPERLALDIAPQATDPLAPHDEAQFTVEARYLYGAPASGNRLIGQLFVEPLREAVPGLPGFQFGDATEAAQRRVIELSEHWLDEAGEGELSVPSEWAERRSPLSLTLQASVQESGGRPVTRRTSVPVWPGHRLPGIRPLFADGRVDASSEARFEIVIANPAGERLAASGVTVRLVMERRDYFWQFSSDEGWRSSFNQKDLVLSAERHDIATDDRIEVGVPTEWGWYRLEAEDPETGLVSSVRFHAGYLWQENAEEGNVRPDKIRLSLDKPRYRAGEVASIAVEAPAAGQGYLMVESAEGPLWWQPIEVPAGGAHFELPIPQTWARHDLYVSALVVRPGERTAHTVPRRAVGVLHLPLDREDRRLALDLQVPDKMRPDRTLPVRLSLPGQAGETVRVIVSAVDVGILNLTRFETPDPFATFFGRRGYAIDHLDIYGQLIEVGDTRRAKLNFGGDQESDRGGRSPITSVELVALQSVPVTLGPDGTAEIGLEIPDFNGELRIMAQAWSDSAYGMAEARTVVAAPLVASLAAPRFLAGGDRTEVAIDLTNLTDRPQTLQPQLQVDGLLAASGEWPERIELAPGARATLRMPLEAGIGMGEGTLSLSVAGLSLPDEQFAPLARQWRIGVRPAWPAQTASFIATLQPGDRPWSLAELAPQYGQLDARSVAVTLSARPPLDLAEHVRELFAYPYGCAEQTTSGLYPSLYARPELLATLGIRGQDADTRRTRIEIGIERLLGMQRYNGSFGLWSSDGEEEYWLTAYVGDFLLRAAEEGFAVPQAALESVRQRLLAYLQNPAQIEMPYTDNAGRSRFAVQAYAAYVLTRHGQAPLGSLRQLAERHEHAPSGLALAQLGFALQRMGDGPRGDALLDAALQRSRDGTRWIGDYGSPLRDVALTLALFEEHALQVRARDRLHLMLSEQLRERPWLSTQERNALFLAGRHGLSRAGAAWQAEVTAATLQRVEGDRPMALRFGEAELGPDFQLGNAGTGTLYQRTTLSGYPRSALPADEDQIAVSRRMLRLDGSEVTDTLDSGELVLVHLTLRARSRVHDALVVDLLPAGLELENQRLDGSARLPSASAEINGLLQRRGGYTPRHEAWLGDRYVAAVTLGEGERVDLLYLARAVTPGVYRVPPPLVESMYRPEVQGRGETPPDLQVIAR